MNKKEGNGKKRMVKIIKNAVTTTYNDDDEVEDVGDGDGYGYCLVSLVKFKKFSTFRFLLSSLIALFPLVLLFFFSSTYEWNEK